MATPNHPDVRSAADAEPPVVELLDATIPSLHAAHLVVLENVNWTIRRNEYWVVAGLPASGKSDLLASAAGLLRLQAGGLRLFGRDMGHLHEEERMKIQLRVGVVFPYGGRLFNQLTVAENLSLPFCYHHNCEADAGEKKVQHMLERMELTGLAEQTPAVITRNLRQRVALARALILSPELLFLDNPLAGLDPREARWWLEFLDGLRKGHGVTDGRPLTLVVSTDDLEPWAERGEQFAYLADRRFVQVGNRAELLNPSTPALRELLPVDWLDE